MGRKKKELPVLENVEITDVAAEGNALARVDEMVVFIPFGAPGDVADVKLDKRNATMPRGTSKDSSSHRPTERHLAASTSQCVADAAGSTSPTISSCNANKNRCRTHSRE